MRTPARYILWLLLAASLSVGLRLAEDSFGFRQRFLWPPDWNGTPDSRYAIGEGPAGSGQSVLVNGFVYQRVPLLHAQNPDHSLRSVQVSLQYLAPSGGGWVGIRGDYTPEPELDLTSSTIPTDSKTPTISTTLPTKPDATGTYRVELPRTDSWKRLTFTASRRTNNTEITLNLGGPAKRSSVRFADCSVAYSDTPADNMLANPTFDEAWPLWAIYPEWVTEGVGGWAPARLLLLVGLLSTGALGFKKCRRSYARFLLQTMAWFSLSPLIIVGSGAIPDLARIATQNLSAREWGAPFLELAGLAQMAMFVGIGWVGFQVAGRRACLVGAVTIPLMAALAMTATVGLDAGHGLPVTMTDFAQFRDGGGPIWLLLGMASIWGGARWALSSRSRKK